MMMIVKENTRRIKKNFDKILRSLRKENQIKTEGNCKTYFKKHGEKTDAERNQE